MTNARLLVLFVLMPCAVLAQPAPSPEDKSPAQRLQALKAAPAVERREQTTVAVAADTTPADSGREVALADIIRDYERHNGAEPGTVAYFRGSTTDFLALDLAKSLKAAQGGGNKVFSAIGGSGSGAGVGPQTTLMAAKVEYKPGGSRFASEKVIGFTAAGGLAVAGRVTKNGDAPVSLAMDTGKVSAVQLTDGATGLTMPVAVTIGGKTQTLTPGQTGTFGDLEVEIESSVNYSSIPAGQREGAAYGLALRVRSASTAANTR